MKTLRPLMKVVLRGLFTTFRYDGQTKLGTIKLDLELAAFWWREHGRKLYNPRWRYHRDILMKDRWE